MIKRNMLIGLSALMLTGTATVYAADNFSCPSPAEIQSTDFTAPSIWLGPPMPHSVPNAVGVGLGGKKVKQLIGVEAAIVNNKNGWVCVYKTEGGVSVNEYEFQIRSIVKTNRYLQKYVGKVSEALDNAEPYLKRYPKNIPLGFVGYQTETP